MILLKISVKKLVIKLEKHIKEYQAKFYSNRRNFYIHMGLENSTFGFKNFQKLLEEVDSFLNEHLPNKFVSKLIHSTK